MPKITSLGHIGLHVHDMEKVRYFYTNVLGFKVTDAGKDGKSVFLSSRPDAEHHEILLAEGRTAGQDAMLLQQIALHVDTLDDVRKFYRIFKEKDVQIISTVTHGIAVSIHFRDPEGNHLEIYYALPIKWPQPFGRKIDIDQDDEGIMAQVRAATTGA